MAIAVLVEVLEEQGGILLGFLIIWQNQKIIALFENTGQYRNLAGLPKMGAALQFS